MSIRSSVTYKTPTYVSFCTTMDMEDTGGTCGFDTLFTKLNVPHILENIFLSLDYDSFQACHKVNNAWKQHLSCDKYQIKSQEMFMEKKKNEEKLFEFSENGKVQEVEKILALGVNPNFGRVNHKANRDGDTPLHNAAYFDHKDVVQLLLDGKADPNKANKAGETPLYVAARKGNKDVIQLLLGRGADPNKGKENGKTPLHKAASNGHKDVVQLLLDKGADPNKAAKHLGGSPLHKATNNDKKDVVELLLDRGADPNMALDNGMTPLHEAALFALTDLVQLLLDRGADPAAEGEGGVTPLSLAHEYHMNNADLIKILSQDLYET